MRRRLILHGHLKDLCPEVIEVIADTAAEAFNALCKLKKNLFRPNLIEGTRPVVRIVGFDTVESLFEKSDAQDLHIVPAFTGGKSGFVKILIGAAFIAAMFIPGVNVAVAGVLGSIGLTSSTVFLMGAGLVLGGLIQILFPVKVADQTLDENNYLGAPGNSVKIGTPIPLLFGRHKAWGQYLSYDTDAVNL